jgi:hypothetical protein
MGSRSGLSDWPFGVCQSNVWSVVDKAAIEAQLAAGVV